MCHILLTYKRLASVLHVEQEHHYGTISYCLNKMLHALTSLSCARHFNVFKRCTGGSIVAETMQGFSLNQLFTSFFILCAQLHASILTRKTSYFSYFSV